MQLILLFAMLMPLIVSMEEPHIMGNEEDNMTRVLSRRKRFLIFPDGSSLQLVFCLQTSAVIPIGDIFLFGSTVALAWELPSDPKFLYMYKKYKKNEGDANRRGDELNDMYYVDSDGKVVAKVPFKRKTFFNPTFAKRSAPFKSRPIEINRTRMHDKQLKRDFLKMEHMDEFSVPFHRESRVGLFQKLEVLFETFGWNGKECVLRKLCESGRRDEPQGSFLQELMRIVFTLPKGSTADGDINDGYDAVNIASGDCDYLYSKCPEFDNLSNAQFTFNNYFSYK